MSEDVLSDEQVAAYKERLAHPLGVGGVLGATMTLAAKTAVAGVPLALLFGVGATAASLGALNLVAWLELQEEAFRLNLASMCMGLGGFFVLYAALQFFKRDRASRPSWLPALFALPLILVGLGIYVIGGPSAAQMPPLKTVPMILAGMLLWRTFFGAFAATAWIRTGNAAAEGQPVDVGAAMQEAGQRLAEVAAVHGGKITAVVAGQQLIVVGIFYALQLAFADAVVVLDRDRPAMRRAGNLSYGMRSRIFRVIAVWFLLYGLVSGAASVAIDGLATYQAAFFDPAATSSTSWIVADVAFGVTLWLETLSLLVMYRDREAQVKAKAALRRHQKALAAS
jgi:hypothetical protein